MLEFTTIASVEGAVRVDAASLFGADFGRLPHIFRILVENVARNAPSPAERDAAIAAIRNWLEAGTSSAEIAFQPSRVLMHDTTCTPALVDIAGMRDGGQTEIQRFERAAGHDDFIGVHIDAADCVAPRDLLPQTRIAGRQIVHDATRIERTHAARQMARQGLQGKQCRARERGTERHDIAVAGRTQHIEDQIADLHRRRHFQQAHVR